MEVNLNRRRSSALTSARRKRITRKIIVTGSAGCGKTAFVKRFLNNYFPEKHDTTVEDFYEIDKVYKGHLLRIELIDMCGSYVFPVMRDFNIQHAHVAMLLYEIGNEASIMEAADISKRIKETRKGSLPVILIGTKLDLQIRGVRSGTVELCTQYLDMVQNEDENHLLTSSKDDINVVKAFNIASEYILRSHNWTKVFTNRSSKTLYKITTWIKGVFH